MFYRKNLLEAVIYYLYENNEPINENILYNNLKNKIIDLPKEEYIFYFQYKCFLNYCKNQKSFIKYTNQHLYLNNKSVSINCISYYNCPFTLNATHLTDIIKDIQVNNDCYNLYGKKIIFNTLNEII
jgi:hypothetical protein